MIVLRLVHVNENALSAAVQHCSLQLKPVVLIVTGCYHACVIGNDNIISVINSLDLIIFVRTVHGMFVNFVCPK